MISLDCYRETDFLRLKDTSHIQKYIMKYYPGLLNEYRFPHFESQFLTPEGDVANLLLQTIFQKGHNEKKIQALKKLQYVYTYNFKDVKMDNFEDIFTRFFLRNISLLYTLNRLDEIDYIKSKSCNTSSIMPYLPGDFKEQVSNIFNPNSKFFDVYNEISSVAPNETFNQCSKIMKKIK